MSQYPIILYPKSLEAALSTKPSIPTFQEVPPQPPGADPQKLEKWVLATSAGLTLLFSLIWGFLGFAVGGLICGAWTWYHVQTFIERKKHHVQLKDKYSEQKRDFERRKRQHHQHFYKLLSPENVAKFRHEQALGVLKTVHLPDTTKFSRRGASEASFEAQLQRYFQGYICTDLALKNPNYKYPYAPDFIYADSKLNLHIDIEIDEPYIYHTGEPIHFKGYWKDEKRNQFFLDRGWVVIRFSEEQVLRHPKSCCKTIATVISAVLQNEVPLTPFQDVPDLNLVPQWTEMEAEQMAKSRLRDRYQSA